MSPALTYWQTLGQHLGVAPSLPDILPTLAPQLLTLAWPDTQVDTLYLPVIWTLHGPLYGECIAQCGVFYIQPWDLSDEQRQVLYNFAYAALRNQVRTGVYLVTFVAQAGQVYCTGLTAMPAAAALVSTLTQKPDLYYAHLLCQQDWPLVEVQTWRMAAVRLGEFDPKEVLLWPGVIWYPDWIGCWVYPPSISAAGTQHPFADLGVML